MDYKVEKCDYCQRLCVSVYSEKQSAWVHIMEAGKYYWMRHRETKQLFLALFSYKDGVPVLKLFDTTEPDPNNEESYIRDPLTVVSVAGTNWNAWDIRNFKRPNIFR
jgi:hypothetical protein